MTHSNGLWNDLVQQAPVPIPARVFIIAEIGINHNGSVDIARQLIDMASSAGCDAVKFQKRTIDIVYTPEQLAEFRESPWGATQREQKEALELSLQDYEDIDAYCRKVGIEWFASSWDIPSQRELRRFDCRFNKVASAMLTYVDFLKEVADEQKMTFISTGMSSYEDIDAAVNIFAQRQCPFVLMHCVSTYPAAEEDLNLHMIHVLRERYGCPVGYSGHETSVSPSVMAAMMGAVAVERHITLDRAMYGSDQAASLARPGLETLVSQTRKIPEIIGDGKKRMMPGEEKVARKLRYWKS